MADAALGATIQVVLETVLFLANDYTGFLGFKEELKRLSKTATRIQGLLPDPDDNKHSPGVLSWLKDLEEEVFKAENVLDEINYENLRQEVKYRSQLKRKLCFFFSPFNTTSFRWRMASKLKNINMNLKRINQEANNIGLVTRYHNEAALSATPASAGATTCRQTDSVVVPNVVGRANDESKIVEMLFSPSDKVVSVIPIVGMAGVGKTTLAKSVYNNPQIDEHFDEKSGKGKKVWVCVAKGINIVELFKLILESMRREKIEMDSREAIVQNIKNELEGKRCFLVLDDVWDEDQILWDGFFNTLKGLKPTNGSWCLVTTRREEVANTMSGHLRMNDRPYKLQKLTDDECWSIIQTKLIAGEEIPNELEAIKEQILRRCDGLPLAATLFGSLLLMNRKEEWPSIVQKSLLDEHQNSVKQVIKVSFDHLSPASVKKCFAYCSIFPQNTEMKKDLLIELWMAEGFLHGRLMEDTGNKYFRILLQSSLLEEVKKWGRTHYKMHDLVHDFAKSALDEDRYLALNSSSGMTEDIITKNTTSLCTLFLESSISGAVLSKFKCLHVLKLSGKDVKVLPASVGELIHLRVIDISDSGITILPETLCKLYNLQTMRIKDDKLEGGLPKKMSNLISMRHLHYYDTHVKFQMPSEMGQLIHLQTLKFFNIGQEDGRGIEELGSLKDLKGSLEIRNIELVNGREGAEGAKLFDKPNLYELKYLWGSGDRENDNCDENLLEGLQPPKNLQKLQIRNFMGDQFPGWFINLSTLVELKFIDCKRSRELPALGQLPSLERLELRGLENIKCMGLSFYGISSGGGQVRKLFPALKYLSLEDMENLVEWKDEDEVRSTTGAAEVDLFPVIERLSIENCFQLISAPSHFPSIEVFDNCHVLLLEKIVSSNTTISSLELTSHMVTDSHDDEHIDSLHLKKRHHSNNLAEDVECLLILEGCGSIPSEMLEHLCHLPSLRHLQLAGLSNLTRLTCDTSLERLSVWNCENLKELPQDLDKFEALRHLNIRRCPRFNKLGGECGGHKSFNFMSLVELNIHYCDGLTSLPSEMLNSCAALQILWVSDCPNLVSFPLDLRQTPSLEILDLVNCPKLMIADMPKGFAFLTSLRKLRIGPFSVNETTEFDWSGLISSSSPFTSLGFYGLPHMGSLPEQLQYLTSLTNLELYNFGIESLPDWIGNLASLEQLELWDCKKLLYLPSMAAMRSLTKLMHLQVLGSPLLKERCNPQSGPNSEWPKVSHIPYCRIS